MRKHAHKGSRTHARPLFMPRLLEAILLDLKPVLGTVAGHLSGCLGDPSEFRSQIRQALEHADEQSSVAYIAALRQVEAFVSKLPSWGASSHDELVHKSLSSFRASEASCRRANRRILHYRRYPRRLSSSVSMVVHMAQDWIYKALGGPPDPSMFDDCGFGPGLTYGMPAEHRHLLYKVSGDQTVTPKAQLLARDVLANRFPSWFEHLAKTGRKLSVVAGNRVTFVPKSATSLRTIAIEPSLNVWLQKAVDNWLKRRLVPHGLRLRDQEFSVELIVEEAQRTLGVATLDLSAASDSVALEAVAWLFPREWYELLDTLRSHYYTTDKGATWSRYEKFSSMGNATTFPVESMIFYALAWACCRYVDADVHRLRVYGDDIIIPPEAYGLLVEVLRLFGFKTNVEKSFAFGRFRETCGVDLLDGVDIRPVYIRELPKTAPQVANLFNRLLCNRFGFKLGRTLGYLHSLVDKPFYGPAYHGWSGTTSLWESPWDDWYEGRNTKCDAYFFAPELVGKRSWSNSYQTWKYDLQRWFYKRRNWPSPVDEETLYRLFLLGVEGGKPLMATSNLLVRTETFYGDWPTLDWWPSCYWDSDRWSWLTSCDAVGPSAPSQHSWLG